MKLDIDPVVVINALVAKRTAYGLRREPYHSRGWTWLVWSNAGCRWHARPATRLAYRYKVDGAEAEVELDANEVLVPVQYQMVEAILFMLDPLPLYGGSTEAWSGR